MVDRGVEPPALSVKGDRDRVRGQSEWTWAIKQKQAEISYLPLRESTSSGGTGQADTASSSPLR